MSQPQNTLSTESAGSYHNMAVPQPPQQVSSLSEPPPISVQPLPANSIVFTQHAFDTQPVIATPLKLGEEPVQLTCPHCSALVTTRTKSKARQRAYGMGCLTFFLGGCWGPCLLPCCFWRKYTHFCPQCDERIGTYKDGGDSDDKCSGCVCIGSPDAGTNDWDCDCGDCDCDCGDCDGDCDCL